MPRCSARASKRLAAAGRIARRTQKPKPKPKPKPNPVAVLAPLPTATAVPTPTQPPTTPTGTTTTPTSTTPVTPPPPTTTPTADPGPVYWGAWMGSHLTGNEAPWDQTAISTFEQHAGKQLSLVHFSSPFANCYTNPCSNYTFPGGEFTKIRNLGAFPVFSWASNALPSDGNQSNYQLSDILSGRHDAYITSWATAARNWGRPFFLRFNWEMNGNWFTWSEGVNGNQSGEYVAAWRHLHNIFTTVGATNTTWVWCPNLSYPGSQDLQSLYPGDDYVDWTCLDGYNSNDPWRSFADLFRASYQDITTNIAPSKPMLVGETGSTETGGSKAAWIADMFTSLATEFPKIRGLQWFDKYEVGMGGGPADWPIESSASATQAFATGIGSSRYKANTNGAADGMNKIPAPTQ